MLIKVKQDIYWPTSAGPVRIFKKDQVVEVLRMIGGSMYLVEHPLEWYNTYPIDRTKCAVVG